MTDEFYMEIALKEAWKYQGLTLPNPSVGAVVLNKDRKILGIGAHQKAGQPHGEVNAIQNALDNNNNDKLIFQDGTIYVTLEPCNHYGKTPPCSNLIKDLGFKRVVYSVADSNPEAEGGGTCLQSFGLEVKSGVLKEEGKKLLEPFLKYQKKNFVLFKWAQNLGGGFTSGKISCDASFKDVHKIRDKIDLIVVGGNTVRTDRPTLDARMVGGKAPDVLILSREGDFDRNIPLFSVPKREVTISSDIDLMDDYRYVLVEGGDTLYSLLKKKIDWVLLYQSGRASGGEKIESGLVEYLHSDILDKDLKIWGKSIE